MSRRIAVLALAIAGSLTCVSAADGQVDVARFSSAAPGGPLPASWKLVTLAKIKRQTRYSLVRDADTTVLRADADASMASLMHLLHFDPRDHPVVEWRWKIAHLLRKSDIATKSGDDFRAAFGEDPPAVSGVAVATDTDNTGESATAFYGDIRFTQ